MVYNNGGLDWGRNSSAWHKRMDGWMVPAVILDNHAVAPYCASEFGAGNRPREHDIGWDMLEMWCAFQFVRERSMCLRQPA